MRKKFLGLLTLLTALTLAGCAQPAKQSQSQQPGQSTTVSSRHTIKFENNGERVATEIVKDGEKLTKEQVPSAPRAPEGYEFVGWAIEGDEVVDPTTVEITADITFHAVFQKEAEGGLSVDDVKEAGKDYYLVLGWWEVNDPDDPTKVTSHLTKATVRLFYQNVIDYLKAAGATNENIANIQFRNYSTATVAQMGELINADADVDIMIGVGNNINSTAGVSLYDGSNDYKFQTPMGDGTARYVACTSYASELGVSTYTWLKNTDAGIASFVRELTAEEIAQSLVPVDLDFKVTVHGDTDVVTTLHTKDDKVTMPEITVPEDKNFKGFALTSGGEVVLDVNKDATLKYDDLKDLVAEGVKAIDLYPVFEAKPVVAEDLVVYVQINGNNLKLPEAKLLEARFNSTLTTEKVKFNFVEGDAATFSGAIGNDSDVVIGGNNPVNNLGKHADGPTANAGGKHFASTNRKVIISDKVSAGHLELAKKLYNFVIADAIEFEVHATFWPKGDNSWVTVEERAAVLAGMTTQLNTYLGITGEDTLLSKYNVKFTDVDVNVTGNKVADLGSATRALREGKGTDLIIGCGGNVDSASGAGMTIVEKKDIPTTMVAAGRKVALVNENPLAREIYDNYFKAAEEPQA